MLEICLSHGGKLTILRIIARNSLFSLETETDRLFAHHNVKGKFFKAPRSCSVADLMIDVEIMDRWRSTWER